MGVSSYLTIRISEMFTRILHCLEKNEPVDLDRLSRLFDIAMTKKMGVLKMAPSYWQNDPKINPRADHLFWMALLLDDWHRIDLAISVLAAEHSEIKRTHGYDKDDFAKSVRKVAEEFLHWIPEVDSRRLLEKKIKQIPTELPGEGEQRP